MAIVPFIYADFIAQFPEFATLPGSAAVTCNFGLAQSFVNNTDDAYVQDIPTRTRFLYLVTAHLTVLLTRGSNVVGLQTSATEGSISAAFSGLEGGRASFWEQTQYGAMFWLASKNCRSMFYVC